MNECDRPVLARGWCVNHYGAWRKHGDPLVNKKPRGLTEVERFWRKVNKTEACWLWTGALCQGYGVFHEGSGRGNTHQTRAHLYAYRLLVGPIPEGLQLDHLCRVRSCCNPDHLEPVSRYENLARGVGTIIAVNSAKTHCPRGHEYDRTYYWAQGVKRGCSTCDRAKWQRWKDRQRAGLV